MKTNQIQEIDVGFSIPGLVVPKAKGHTMNPDGLRTVERIEEILMMCARKNPVYEQISSFSVALYAMGFYTCSDFISFPDVESGEAAAILKDYFVEIREEALPMDYHIADSKDRYLLVAGDPLHPVHFALFVDSLSASPFFSKLPFFGSGFDSLEELKDEFQGMDGIQSGDFHVFKKIGFGEIPPESRGKIYIVKND
jgi:hypothetical protein